MAALAGALGFAACDAQVTSDYRGEELVKLRGNVVSTAGVPPAEAALLWWVPGALGAAGGSLTTRVTTEGKFPASFSLSLYRSPPAEAVVPFTGARAPALALPALSASASDAGRLSCRGPASGLDAAAPAGLAAVATIAAVRPGIPDDALADNVIGLAEGVALVYVPAGAGAGTYRLMRIEWLPESAPDAFACTGGPAAFMRLVDAGGGVDGTEIEIHIRAG